jgi:hypothetical protein
MQGMSTAQEPAAVPTVELTEEDMKRLDDVRESVARGERGVPHAEVIRELEERKRRRK